MPICWHVPGIGHRCDNGSMTQAPVTVVPSQDARYEALIRLADAIRAHEGGVDLFDLLQQNGTDQAVKVGTGYKPHENKKPPSIDTRCLQR